MALVFVHGVATRRDPDYERGVAARNAFFRRYVFPALGWDEGLDPFNAYWGGDAAEFRWHHASLPQEDVEEFGPSAPVEAVILAETAAPEGIDAEKPLSTLARRSVEDAVDLVFASAAQEVNDRGEVEALVAMAYRASERMAELRQDPRLVQASNDDEWLEALAAMLAKAEAAAETEVEAFGGAEVWDRLSESVVRIRGAAGRLGGAVAAKLLRDGLHRRAALFIGDVFIYLDTRGDRESPGPIVQEVVGTLEQASAAGGPLAVVAHSMGGEIVYDVLSYYRPDIHVDRLITVGSQVGLFEELCLLKQGRAAGCPDGPTLVPALGNVDRWINVFDRNDMLGFATQRIFAAAKDYDYSTGKGVLAAHSAYFKMPSFFQRLADRVRQQP
jgi:hypothetical protein